MKIDLYTKFILTLIAVLLAALFIKVNPIVIRAAGAEDIRIEGFSDMKESIRSIDNNLARIQRSIDQIQYSGLKMKKD